MSKLTSTIVFSVLHPFLIKTNGFIGLWSMTAHRPLLLLLWGKPVKPISKFRMMLTHDVDKLRGYHYFAEPVRYFMGDLLKRRKGFSSLRRLQAYTSGEPWASVNSIMNLSEWHGTKSNFFFMGPSTDSMDSPYAITMKPLLKRVVDQIVNRGHMIGFHPGYQTYKDSKIS